MNAQAVTPARARAARAARPPVPPLPALDMLDRTHHQMLAC